MPLTREQTRWTRRRLLQSASVAGGALAVGALTAERVRASGKPPSIAIVGGGIAGLNAAYQLKKSGLRATVYEGKTVLGGRIRSLTDVVGDGLVVDAGGELINSDHADLLALAEEFNLKLFNRDEDAAESSFPKTAYYFDGSNRPESEVAEKLRPIAEQIARDAALLDQNFERFAPPLDRLSVSQYLDIYAEKIPDPFIRELLEASIRTEYGVEAKESSSLQLIFNLPVVDGNAVEVLGDSDEIFVVEGGSSQLIEGLAGALRGQIQTGKILKRVTSGRRGVRLLFADGQSVEADFAIVAVSINALKQIDLRVPLPRDFQRFIREVSLGSNEKLFGGFSEKVWRQEEGFVEDIWTDLGYSEAWDATQRQVDRTEGALTFFLGGSEVAAARALPTARLGREFVARLEAAVPGVEAAATGEFFRTYWAQDPFVGGGYSTFKPGQLTEFGRFLYIESEDPEERQDVTFGRLTFAGEHLSDEFYGYMNGAAQTGRLAARVVASKIMDRSAKVH